MPVFFEDFPPGAVAEYGARTVTREEIVAFAALYDPQPMHLDEAAASHTMLGGLAASGWHSVCLLMRLNVDHLFKGGSSMGAPGIDEVRWLKPVRPGDTLSVRSEVLDARASASRPDRGYVTFRFELRNQHGDTVMTQQGVIMFPRRARRGS